jgi:hypothetical protein
MSHRRLEVAGLEALHKPPLSRLPLGALQVLQEHRDLLPLRPGQKHKARALHGLDRGRQGFPSREDDPEHRWMQEHASP